MYEERGKEEEEDNRRKKERRTNDRFFFMPKILFNFQVHQAKIQAHAVLTIFDREKFA